MCRDIASWVVDQVRILNQDFDRTVAFLQEVSKSKPDSKSAANSLRQFLESEERRSWSDRSVDFDKSDLNDLDPKDRERIRFKVRSAKSANDLDPFVMERFRRAERDRWRKKFGAVPGIPTAAFSDCVGYCPRCNVEFSSIDLFYDGQSWYHRACHSEGPIASAFGIAAFAVSGKSLAKAVERAAQDVEPEPTEAQKKSGNYRKGHIVIQGLPIALENARGGYRSGVGKDGKPWRTKMAHHYGYIKKTESEADGDHIDVFIGPEPDLPTVYIIDQKNEDGKFDEHKVMVGFPSSEEAKKGYLACYTPGWKGLGAITPMSMNSFKAWIKEGKTDRPVDEKKF